MSSPGPLRVKSSPASLEPGLVGIWHPVLLMPGSIGARLSDAEMRAVIAHEMGHYRRRDYLSAVLLMLVAALFWFYPLVWWLGARLVEKHKNTNNKHKLEAG